MPGTLLPGLRSEADFRDGLSIRKMPQMRPESQVEGIKMLKVNLKKISMEDYAIKYHLFPTNDNHSFSSFGCGITVDRIRNYVFVQGQGLDTLFDMISNGDVVKE